MGTFMIYIQIIMQSDQNGYEKLTNSFCLQNSSLGIIVTCVTVLHHNKHFKSTSHTHKIIKYLKLSGTKRIKT